MEYMTYFINKINEMFEANAWTDDGRVKVDYAENCNLIVVKVMDKTGTIDVEPLTDFGIMFAIMDKVKELYD